MGLIRKAGLLVDHGEAEIWVGHKWMHNVNFPHNVPRRWVDRIRTVPGVRPGALPDRLRRHDAAFGQVRGPDRRGRGARQPARERMEQERGDLDAIRQADGVVVDDCEGEKLEYPRLGDVREINGRRARIVGMSHGIMGFLVTPYVFTTYERAAAYINQSKEVASYFLVQINPGADPEEVCTAIRRRVPELEAMPRDAYGAHLHQLLDDAHGAGHQLRHRHAVGLAGGPGHGRPDALRDGARPPQGEFGR